MLLIRAGLDMPVLDWTVNNFNCQVSAGLLSYGTVIAVKQLSSKSKQGNRELVNEIGLISTLEHPHLFKLHGCCIKGNQLLLVYEYMENNSLARALFVIIRLPVLTDFGEIVLRKKKIIPIVVMSSSLRPFAIYLQESGIVAQCTTPGTPQQNGVAERRNRTLKDMGEALKTANYILNRVPSKSVPNTPFEMWTGRKPSLAHLHV
ncbi:unnamed protein product [Prunus armeniaca]